MPRLFGVFCMIKNLKKEKVLISACLLGTKCRYDGKARKLNNAREISLKYEFIPCCPEMDGGLGVPRPRAWIEFGGGKEVWAGKANVVSENGVDVTENFLSGARKTLETVKTYGAKKAFLKSRSPSCGVGSVYNDGGNKLVEGNGVAAELLIMNGIEVKSFD